MKSHLGSSKSVLMNSSNILINSSFSEGIFPSKLIFAKVIPLFKNGGKSNINNYRPICVLPVFIKVFDKLYLVQLLNYLEGFIIICDSKFAFRRGKLTIDDTVDILVFILERNDICIFQSSKAFDFVELELLLDKCEATGIRRVPLVPFKELKIFCGSNLFDITDTAGKCCREAIKTNPVDMWSP